ncbi:MAG: Zn-ribbon domain-containing OB-fold protein [Haloferacaceae archaeon]
MPDFSDDRTAFTARLCVDCGAVYGHPPTVCRECGCETFEDRELSGAGTVYASTVVRVPGAGHQGQEPFTVAVVDVGDGPAVRVTARVEGDGGLPPETPVEYLGRRDDAFWFQRPRDANESD